MTETLTGECTVRDQDPVDATARVTADEHSPSELWQAILDSDEFERTLVDAVRDRLAGVPHYERVSRLREAGVTAGEGGYARLVAGFERPPESDAYARALDVTRQFGQGEVTPFGHRLDLADLQDGPLAILDATDTQPTIAVRIGEDFPECRRDQRERTCRLLATLASVCTVSIVATGLTRRWLAHEHGDTLPSSFSEQCNPGYEPDTPAAERVDAAREQFNPDGRAVRMLRDIANEPGETLSYHELTALYEVSDTRVSQLVGDLEETGLVDRYGSRRDRRVDLLPAGREFLTVLDEETDRQQRFDELFSDTGTSANSDVLSRPHGRASPDGNPDQQPPAPTAAPYRTRYLDRADHHAATAIASNGDITGVKAPIPGDEQQTRYVSYDEHRDEAVVAIHATTPLQYMTSLALSLASPRFFDTALPTHRLNAISDPPAILRDARCIGGLSDEALEDAEQLRENLIQWGEDLADMTRKLEHEEYEDRDRFCGEILRSAHGLAGTITHLLDVIGIELVREIRTPYLNHGQLEQLARTVSVSVAIQSKYGAFATYRQLYEPRDEKRQTALTPQVDATDPTGEYIGSLILRGPQADRLGYHVEGALTAPAEIHEEAPEIAVPVTVTTPGRPAYTAAVNRMLKTKGIRATPNAVTMFQALAGSPYAVTEAIHWLGKEDQSRTIRLDEVRVALSTLEADRLLPEAPPTISHALQTLLSSTQPLTQTELAEQAGISTRSLRKHLDTLLALDLVRNTAKGYRLSLPFEDSERGETILPEAVDSDTPTLQDLVFDVTLAYIDAAEASRLGNPDDPLGRPFFGPTLETGTLRRHLPGINPYLSVAMSLCNHPEHTPATVEFGADLEQASIQNSSRPGGIPT